MGNRRKRDEETAELTGVDAPADEAEFGSAGNGADPFEGDLAGTTHASRSHAQEASGADILPDRVETLGQEKEEEAPEPTAQPTEWPDGDASRLP